MSSIETLKAWVHWKRNEKDVTEDDLEFANAVNDLISQVGTWKAKHDVLAARVKELEFCYADLNSYMEKTNAKLARADKVVEAARQIMRAKENMKDTSGAIHRLGLVLDDFRSGAK